MMTQHNLSLLWDLVVRDITSRYKNSYLGLVWVVVNPLALLIIYTFIFSEIFKAKWSAALPGATGAAQTKVEFAMILFAGLMLFTLFSEAISRAPSLIVGNPNYVKKIKFPLELLGLVALCSALFNFLISAALLVLFQIVAHSLPPATLLLMPVVILPMLLLILGLTWWLSSLGVYLRDIGQFISIILMGLMFLSPIFFPATAIPKEWAFLVEYNPLTAPIESLRAVMLFGKLPDWGNYFYSLLVGALVAYLGYQWLQFTRKGFSDVL